MNDATEDSSARGRRKAMAAAVLLVVIVAAVLLLLRLVGGDDDRSSLGDSSLDDATAASSSHRSVLRRPQSSTTVAASPEPTSSLTLLAVDDRTSEPIRDVLAYLTAWRSSSLQPAQTPIAAQSDAGGLMTLDRRMLELAWTRGESLTVWKAGYVPVAVESAPPTTPAVVRLQAAEAFRCCVNDPRGRPVVGAIVAVATELVWNVVPADFGGSDDRLPAASPASMLRIAKTNGTGHAVIHGLTPGPYFFTVVHAGYAMERPALEVRYNKVDVPCLAVQIKMLPIYAAAAIPHRASGRFVSVVRDRLDRNLNEFAELMMLPIKNDFVARFGVGAAVRVVALDDPPTAGESGGEAVFTWLGADGRVWTSSAALVPIESVVPIVLGDEIDTEGGVVEFEVAGLDGVPMAGRSIPLHVANEIPAWRGGPLVVSSTVRVDLPAGRYRVSVADRLIKHAFEAETFAVSAGSTTRVQLRAKTPLRQLSLTVDEDIVEGIRPARKALRLVVDDPTTRHREFIDCPFGDRTSFHLAVGFRGSIKCELTNRRRLAEEVVVEEGNGTIDLTPAFRRAFHGDSDGASQSRPSELPKNR